MGRIQLEGGFLLELAITDLDTVWAKSHSQGFP